ncbi:Transposase [Phytophthora palmivora]|uniref:Transposase n=1 Tax=Phytophthora palmivora TaxID=4796 RepID=A0A2P4WW93_9STRA|nr:Transposase [Phytophthora palmivora]
MQGVDRLDQIRARFSLSDGHSFKKWHKKLALALIDVARANAYLTRRLTQDLSKARDPHRDFVVQLCSELLSGKWKEAPSERLMFYADSVPSEDGLEQASPSSTFFTDMNRKRRKEERYATEVTVVWVLHKMYMSPTSLRMPTNYLDLLGEISSLLPPQEALLTERKDPYEF